MRFGNQNKSDLLIMKILTGIDDLDRKYEIYKIWSENLNVLQFLWNSPAGTRRPGDVPWRSPKGPNVRDLQGTFRGLLGDQQKNW